MLAMRWRLAGLIVALAGAPLGALAAPLDEEACKGVKAEREGLLAKGLEADIAKGAEWGKSNLSPDRLKEVARLIELNEQLTFRCGQLTVTRPDGKPLLKKDPPPAPAAAAATPASSDPQAKPPAKKKKPAAAAKPVAPDGSAPGAGAAPAQTKAP
jgi:hypothetical protein